MVTSDSTKLYKIPLKNCQNSVIEHDLVTIRLRVEWPDKCGDDPRLVVDITDKKPSLPSSYPQQSQLSSMLVHPVHHHHETQLHQHQQQENFLPVYQQQQHYYQHHLLTANNQDLSRSTTAMISGDHNDVSSTTTSISYDVIQPQSQFQSQMSASSEKIQQIKNDLTAELPPGLRFQSTSNQQYLPSQHVIQAPSSNMNDSRSHTSMSTISPPSIVKQIPSATTYVHDLQKQQQQPSSVSPSSLRSVVCRCLDPLADHHEPNCSVTALIRQQSSTNLTSTTVYVHPNNRTGISRSVIPTRTQMNDTISLCPTKDSMLTTTLLPFANCNLIQTAGLSSDGSTIVCQSPSFIHNNPMGCSLVRPPSLHTNSNFPQSKFIFPPHPSVIVSTQPNYPTTSPRQISPALQASIPLTHSRQRKKQPVKRNLVCNSELVSLQNPDDSQAQVHVINSLNSPTKQQQSNNHTHSSPVPSRISITQRIVVGQDDPQASTNALSCNTQYILVNDTAGNTTSQQQQQQKQHSPHTNAMIRSPVKLELSMSQNPVQVSVSPHEVDQIITEVVKGQGTIVLNNKSVINSSQQQKQSTSPQLVWQQNGPVTTKTYLSQLGQKEQQQQRPLSSSSSSSYDSSRSTLTYPNVANIPRQIVPPSILEQNAVNTLVSQTVLNTNKKRNRPKLMTDSAAKRYRKPNSNISESTITSSIPSTSPVINKPVLSTNAIISSEDLRTIHISKETPGQDLTDDLFETLDMDCIDTLQRNSDLHDPTQQILYSSRIYDIELEDAVPSKTDERFNSSTPPPLLPPSISASTSIPDQLLTPASIEKPVNTTTTTTTSSVSNSHDVYEDFFSSHWLPSRSNWQENQVTSSVLTPPDVQNSSTLQHRPQPVDNINSGLQTQVLTSQVVENNSKPVNRMDNHDDVQASSAQETKSFPKAHSASKSIKNKSFKQSLKPSKQKNRFKATTTKTTCTRCGRKRLIDITQYEFPQQKGLIYECVSCGNNSLRSNVSANERRNRLDKVAADHLTQIECQFCHTIFHSHNDYLMHLRNDHASNKPL